MCGIVGYVGDKPALDIVIDGLRRLEYRGYDSAGVAVVADAPPEGSGESSTGAHAVATEKRAGKLGNLVAALGADGYWSPNGQPAAEAEPAEGTAPAAAGGPPSDRGSLAGSTTGMGHTRWATHGAPTDRNAHPHTDCSRRVAIIHNGIIENFAALRAELTEAGHELRSDTDTEVVAHLLEEAFPRTGGDLAEAMRQVCRRLSGAFTLVAVHADAPDVVVGARRNSPLVVGLGDGENFLASDVAAFIAHTRRAIELGQDQVVELRRDGVTITNFDGTPAVVSEYHVDWDASAAEKGGYDYFMLKEIAEQPRAVADTLLGRVGNGRLLILDEMRLTNEELREADKIIIVACGTAYHAGLIAKYAIEHWTRIPCEVELASEFRYRDPIVDRQTLVIAISQSGETMDTLMAVRHAREQGARVLAICNVNGSTIPRECDAVLYTHAGPEVGVAATKTFLTQLVACNLVALYLGQVRGTKYGDEVDDIIRQLTAMPDKVEKVLETMEPVRDVARSLADERCVLFLGRHVGYPVALEGALKLKELAYMHAEGFAAGELKHGPLALIEDGLPVVVVVPSPTGRGVLHDKIVSNIQEIRARGAKTVVIAEEGDDAVVPYSDVLVRIPRTPTLLQPLVAAVPLQVFACELATAKGNDIDQPRNLAKSVTVE
jgi:glutamine---fructose-6-phosphate transaminase (isomerizing)